MKAATQVPTRSWVARLFSEEHRFWISASVVLGMVSLLKGIRLPSRWTATQALVNYDHGLVKRGLFGAATGAWLHGERYSHFAAFSFALLLALVCMIAVLIVRSGMGRSIGNGEPVAAFCASFAVTYLAHLVGYMDVLVAMLAIGLLLIRNAAWRFVAAIPLCVMGILIHELFFVVFLPVVLLSWIVDAVRKPAQRKAHWTMAAVLLLICVGVTLKLSLKRARTMQEVAVMQTEITRRADFPVREDFFPVLSRSIKDNLRIVQEQFAYRIQFQWFAMGLVEFLPTIALLLYAVRLAVWQLAKGRVRTWLMSAAFVAAIAPFAMHSQGFDVGRFNAWIVVDCLLVLAVVAPRIGEGRIALPSWYRNATVMTIALSMASGEGLMDFRGVNVYPFSAGLGTDLVNLVHHRWEPPQY